MGKIKYFGAYITPILALITFNVSGIFAYAGIFFLYLLIPILENIIPKDSYNFSKAEKQLAKHDFYYDLILYLLVPLHLYVIYVFLNTIFVSAVPTSDLIAYVLMMGTLLGVNGINGGHELGHKTDHPFKLFLAHILLTTSIQNHFVTYHNSGHHRDVATPNDLTSAKKGDIFYLFAIRSQIGGYFKTTNIVDTGNVTTASAVYGEIEIAAGTGDHYGTSHVFQAQYDNNDTVAQTNTTYLYYGNYAGVLPTTAYGVYIADAVTSYFGGTIRSAGDVVAYYSDERLKDFHGTIPNAMDKVKQLNGYYFTENQLAKDLGYNNDSTQVGVSAQEVEAVLPEIVKEAAINTEKGTDYKTVQYEKLTALLIEAVKEQQTEIDELKKLVKDLMSR